MFNYCLCPVLCGTVKHVLALSESHGLRSPGPRPGAKLAGLILNSKEVTMKCADLLKKFEDSYHGSYHSLYLFDYTINPQTNRSHNLLIPNIQHDYNKLINV